MPTYEPFYYGYAGVKEGWSSFPRNRVIEFIKNHSGEITSILDIGCGTAEILSYIPEKILYTGIERSQYAVEEAEKRWKNRLGKTNFIVNDSPPYSFPETSFDCVLLLFSLEHVWDPRGVLQECRRLLKKDGFLMILAPNLEFPFAWPSALRHMPFWYRSWFHILRIWDYTLRLFGIYSFRIVKKNFTDATGTYEKKDDDLRVFVSSWEVIHFLGAHGYRMQEFWEERELHGIKRFIRLFPGFRWYGIPLAAVFTKES